MFEFGAFAGQVKEQCAGGQLRGRSDLPSCVNERPPQSWEQIASKNRSCCCLALLWCCDTVRLWANCVDVHSWHKHTLRTPYIISLIFGVRILDHEHPWTSINIHELQRRTETQANSLPRHRLRPRQLLHKRLHPHLQRWRWDLVREVNQQWRMFFFSVFVPCFSIIQIPILFSLLTCLESEDEAELSSRVLGWGCGSRTCTISCTRPKVDCWALTFQMFCCCGVRTV